MYASPDEISSLSPAAAAASNLLKSGLSLSSIYAEHCRVVSELQKKTEENERIERYVNELIEVKLLFLIFLKRIQNGEPAIFLVKIDTCVLGGFEVQKFFDNF